MAGKNEVATIPASEYAVMQYKAEDVLDIIKESLGNDRLRATDLDRITVPTGGGRLWTVPTLEGEQNVSTISGVVLVWKQQRAYWQSAYDGGNVPPDCYSDDDVMGHCAIESGLNLGGECASCPMSQWGTKRGQDGNASKGQACKQIRQLYLLRSDSLLPVAISVPPTSLSAVKKYFLRLAANGLKPSAVVTALTLTKVKAQNVPEYSQITLAMESRLTPQEAAAFASLAAALRPMLEVPTVLDASSSLDSIDATAL
jgi:hypothetical protein